MLIDSNGVISIVRNCGFVITLSINKLELSSQVSSKSSIQILKDFIKPNELKQLARALLYYFPITPIAISSIIFVGEKMINEDTARNVFYSLSFVVLFPSINFLALSTSILPYSKYSMTQVIKHNPQLTLECLLSYMGVYMVQNYIGELLMSNLKSFYLNQNNIKRTVPMGLLYIIYLLLANPLCTSIFQSIILSPIKNISAQYCRILIDSITSSSDSSPSSSSSKTKTSSQSLNPITIASDIIKNKGYFGLFNGIGYTFIAFYFNYLIKLQ